MLPLGARPHWGKLFQVTGQPLRERSPRWDDVVAMHDRIDPERRFGDACLEHVLGS